MRVGFYLIILISLAFSALAEPVKLRVAEAQAHADSEGKQAYIEVALTEESQLALARFTKDRVGKMIQLTVAKRIMPTRLRSIILGRNWSLHFNSLSLQEANEIAEGLNSGKMPFEVDDIPN